MKASLVHTTSASGLAGNFGQANYGSAKLGILGLSRIAVIELHKYGVRSNAVSPAARTRLSLTIPGADQQLKAPDDEDAFDPFDPANVSPLIGWLAQADCPATGQVFHVIGDPVVRHFDAATSPPAQNGWPLDIGRSRPRAGQTTPDPAGVRGVFRWAALSCR